MDVVGGEGPAGSNANGNIKNGGFNAGNTHSTSTSKVPTPNLKGRVCGRFVRGENFHELFMPLSLDPQHRRDGKLKYLPYKVQTQYSYEKNVPTKVKVKDEETGKYVEVTEVKPKRVRQSCDNVPSHAAPKSGTKQWPEDVPPEERTYVD